MVAFLSGMAVVFLVLPLEKFIFTTFPSISIITVILWASVEEIFKYVVAYFSAPRNKEMD